MRHPRRDGNLGTLQCCCSRRKHRGNRWGWVDGFEYKSNGSAVNYSCERQRRRTYQEMHGSYKRIRYATPLPKIVSKGLKNKSMQLEELLDCICVNSRIWRATEDAQEAKATALPAESTGSTKRILDSPLQNERRKKRKEEIASEGDFIQLRRWRRETKGKRMLFCQKIVCLKSSWIRMEEHQKEKVGTRRDLDRELRLLNQRKVSILRKSEVRSIIKSSPKTMERKCLPFGKRRLMEYASS